MTWIVRFSVDRPWTTIGLVAALTLVLGGFLPRIELDTDPKNMLDAHAPVRVGNARVEQEFALPANTIVVGLVSERGIFRKDTLGRLFALTRDIAQLDGVSPRDVVSLSTSNNAVSRNDTLEIRPALAAPPASDAEVDAIRNEVLGNPIFLGRLVAQDGRAAAIYVPIRAGGDGQAVADGIRALVGKLALPDDERVHIAGDPIVSETMAIEVFRQLAIFSPLAGLFMFIVLFAIFRNLPMVIAVMFVSMISTVWAMGLHIALGLTVHLMSAMIPVFLMAIATDSVHIFNELGFRLRGGATRRDAILATMAVVGRPVVFSDLTAAAGFAALASSTFPAIRLFGIFVAIGTIGILVLSFTLVPALLAVVSEARLRAGAARAEPSALASRLLRGLGRIAVNRSRSVGIVVVALVVIAGVGLTRIRINNNMVHWFSPTSELRIADAAFNQRLGGTCPGYLVVSGTDWLFNRPEGLQLLEGLGAAIDRVPGVGKVVSLADVMKQTYAALRGPAFRKLPDSEDAIAQLLLVIGSGGRPQDLDNFVNPAQSKANMIVQLTTWDIDAFNRVVATAQAYLAAHPVAGVQIEPAGIAHFNVVWNDEMLLGMLTSFAWGLGLVLLLLMWEYRSLRIGALAFLPLLLTTFLIFGVMGLIGKDFDMPISVLSTLTLGLAIDFAIHFVSRLKTRLAEADAGSVDERSETIGGGDPAGSAGVAGGKAPRGIDDALRWTIERPGLGIIRNALVFSVGFIVMAFASFLPYITVGVLMATIMLLSSLATLLCLPAIIRAFRRMSPRALGAGLVIALVAGAAPRLAHADPPGADEIVKREQLAYYYPGSDFRAKVTMKLIGKAGDVRERRVSMLRKNLGAAGTDQRYLIVFHKPDDVRRTAFLVWKYPNRDDDRWLFLPAVDLVRRIAASDQRSSFVGSDFTYEDISGRDLAGDKRSLLRRDKLGDAECFVVESTPIGEASYARRVSWIDAATFLPRKEEYYDRSNQLFKVFTGDVIQTIAGVPTITLRTMKDVATGHQTTVEMTAVEYNLGVEDDVFTERYLRRPPARWITE